MKTQIFTLLLLIPVLAKSQCDTAHIAYPQTSICQNNPSIPCLILATTGGIFFGTNGLTLDTTNGTINPATSTIGQHAVTYRTTGTCPDTTTINVQILPAPDPSFLYPGLVCTADPNNPLPTLNTPGGSFSSIGPGLTFANNSTGEIDLSTTQAGTYLIMYVVGNQCPDSAVQIVTILPQTPADFHYPDTVYCQSQPIAAPVILGQGGGRFWTSTPGVILDSATGFIDLPNSQFSWPTIFYESPGPCPDTASFWMVIAPQGNAAFTYAPTSFCTTDPNPVPIITGDTNGTFSCIHGNISIDPHSGVIDLKNSQPSDSILIQYYAPGLTTFCPDSTTIRIRIYAPDTNISVSYPDTAYCLTDLDPAPIVAGPTGGTFGAVPAGLVFASPFSGVLDLSASQPGTYSVRYYPPGACSDTSGNFVLTVLPPPSLGLAYPTSEACQGAGPVLPLGLTDSLGTFSKFAPGSSGNGLPDIDMELDSVSGAINPDSSEPGNYAIYYSSGRACPLDTSFSFRIHSKPNPELFSSADSNTICEGDEVQLMAFGADKFEFFYQDSLVRALSANPVFAPSFHIHHGDKFRINALNLEGQCTARDSLTMRVISPPEILTLSAPSTVSSGQSFLIDAQLDRDSLHLKLDRAGSAALQIPPHKQEVIFSHNTFFSVQETLTLQDSRTIGTFTMHLRPLAGTCPGPAESLTITVLPTQSDLFIPGLITPNGDGRNDVWEIRLRDGLHPEDFHVRVLNRSGGEVFRADRLEAGWNPAGLADGVYWYVVEDLSGNAVKSGGLTIRRR